MAHAQNSVIITRPAAEVYAFLADGLNNPKWRPAVISIELVQGKVGEIGAEYRQQLKGPGGRPIAGDYRIISAEPGRRLEFVVTAGPARPKGDYLLEQTAEGPKVTFTLDFEPRGLMRLMGPMIQKTMEAEVGQLTALKAVLEQG
ncbi:MAG: hypothetical protein K0S68_431 [Candidatus Saccharibacteria bacterium]|nr:hypothetical protein [Candidatus Saccharibacteria bacterium]